MAKDVEKCQKNMWRIAFICGECKYTVGHCCSKQVLRPCVCRKISTFNNSRQSKVKNFRRPKVTQNKTGVSNVQNFCKTYRKCLPKIPSEINQSKKPLSKIIVIFVIAETYGIIHPKFSKIGCHIGSTYMTDVAYMTETAIRLCRVNV